MTLHEMADQCKFGEMRKQLVRDRLVVGIRNRALSEQLQLDSELTLEMGVKKIRQREAVHGQQVDLRDGDTKQNPIIVDELRSKMRTRQRRPTQTSHTKAQTSGSQDSKSKKQCRHCGGASHKREDCPAIEAQCHRCGKKGHYHSQCLTKLSSTQSAPVLSTEAELQTLTLQETYLNTLNTDSWKSWSTTIQVGTTTLPFKLDTGAEVSAVSEKAFNSLSVPPQLQRSTRILYGPERVPLTVLGQFLLT